MPSNTASMPTGVTVTRRLWPWAAGPSRVKAGGVARQARGVVGDFGGARVTAAGGQHPRARVDDEVVGTADGAGGVRDRRVVVAADFGAALPARTTGETQERDENQVVPHQSKPTVRSYDPPTRSSGVHVEIVRPSPGDEERGGDEPRRAKGRLRLTAELRACAACRAQPRDRAEAGAPEDVDIDVPGIGGRDSRTGSLAPCPPQKLSTRPCPSDSVFCHWKMLPGILKDRLRVAARTAPAAAV